MLAYIPYIRIRHGYIQVLQETASRGLVSWAHGAAKWQIHLVHLLLIQTLDANPEQKTPEMTGPGSGPKIVQLRTRSV